MENPVKVLLTGNWIMALCGVFYLAWWVVVFRPPKPRNSPVGWALLALAFLAGIAGFYLMGRTLAEPLPNARPGVPGLRIVLAGAVAYAVLLAGTTLIFHRQVTSELLIIVAWTVLELCAVNFLYRCGALSPSGTLSLACLILSAAASSLVCYLLYYCLPYTPGFIAGCVPLALAVVTIALVNLAAGRII